MVRDDVQFVKKHNYPDGHNGPSYQAHSPIKVDSGEYLLDVAIEHAGQNPIHQTMASSTTAWREKHLKTIYFAYAKAPYFGVIYPQIEQLISKKYRSLAELNLNTILWAIGKLTEKDIASNSSVTAKNINNFLRKQTIFRIKRIKHGSQSQFYKKNIQASANEKIISLCKEVGATEYFCGGTAVAAYLDDKIFAENGIKIVVQDWECAQYSQQFTKSQGFVPNLSIIDLLMNVSVDEARSVLNG